MRAGANHQAVPAGGGGTLPTVDATAQAEILDDTVLRQQWERRSRRVGAAGWLTHAGHVLFELSEYRDNPVARRVLRALLARDVANLIVQLVGVPGEAIALSAFGIDTLAAARLRRVIPPSRLLRDHAISQFGLSVGWSIALANPKRRTWACFLYPVMYQVVLARLWRLPVRPGVLYVSREAAWSAAALWAVADWGHQLGQAVTSHQIDAKKAEQYEREAAVARVRTSKDEELWFWAHHNGLSALTMIRNSAERLRRRSGDGAYLVVQQAHQEGERLRQLSLELTNLQGTVLVASIERLRVGRSREGLATRWRGPGCPQVYLTEAHSAALEHLIKTVLVHAPRELTLSATRQSGTVRLIVEGQFSNILVSEPFSSTAIPGAIRLVGDLQCHA
jgi:hypothetical protein